NNGETIIEDIPCPKVPKGAVLIRTRSTLVSAGTERMLVDFGKANWIDKARQQPDKVRMVVDKIKTDGLAPTLDAVRAKLNQPLPMGYCNVGTVVEVGEGVSEFSVGDRVVSNGKHAEVVAVAKNLCAKIPDNVTDEQAVFTVIGAIGLQGIRLAQPTLGETFVVTGLGLIGLITVQLLRAHGCRVVGIDFDAEKLALARDLGAETVNLSAGEDPIAITESYSRGRGVDGVLITAATKSNEPVHQAAQMCRKRGRIVLVGVTGLELSRADFFEKELSFQVSCSYGPGRYDPDYEEEGHDYPVGFVRWTEQRNFEAVLDMLASERLETYSLISHRFQFDNAQEAYELVGSDQPSLGIVLNYKTATDLPDAELTKRTLTIAKNFARESSDATVSFIGAGNYASQVLIPAFKNTGANLRSVVSAGGVSAVTAARKNGFSEVTTEAGEVFADNDVNTVVVATRHDSHADLVCRALSAGKHVFVEKPLALTQDELQTITDTYTPLGIDQPAPLLMVGFNRRFAPHVQKIKSLISHVKEPKTFVMTVNAGAIPADHWTQDPKIGGGRIIGEGCHFIDLLRYLAAQPINNIQAMVMRNPADGCINDDKVTFSLQFEDGSFGTVHYLANGHKSFPKERLEVFCAGRILQLDNFRRLTGYGWPGFKNQKLWRQDKGNNACAVAFINAINEGQPSPIPFNELVEVTKASIEIADIINR
ncbi:MAG: bi-domain-containing oxidoreductase, partial [Gammaproteobacteria bacterium]